MPRAPNAGGAPADWSKSLHDVVASDVAGTNTTLSRLLSSARAWPSFVAENPRLWMPAVTGIVPWTVGDENLHISSVSLCRVVAWNPVGDPSTKMARSNCSSRPVAGRGALLRSVQVLVGAVGVVAADIGAR